MNKLNSNTLKTKQHYEILDGLRGIAALGIVIFHFMEIVYPDYNKNFIGHGFLAVDFFFCLSGFVIGYAYDDRIEKIGITEFFKLRVIRLHPLVILGSVLGLLTFLFDPFSSHPVLYETGTLILIFLTSIFLIPFPVMPERYFNLFSLNAPSWSLFWEYIANIFYAFILYKISRRYLLLFLTLSSVVVVVISYKAGNLMGGWAKENFWDGGARICYSFLAGLLIYRSNLIIKNKLGFISLSVLLFLSFIMPFFKWNWLAESIVVLFYFPLLIGFGAGATLTQGLKELCMFSGKISYPLYMTHYSLMWIFGNFYNSTKAGTTQVFYIVTIGVIFLIALAYLAMVFFDIPVRRYLSNKRKQD